MLTYILNVAVEAGFIADAGVIRAMHFMLLEHDLAKSPGRFRTSETYIRDDREQHTVYTGPDPDRVPGLMDALAHSLAQPGRTDTMVRAAMMHLNLVMIHPFKDGNGRMARALQTLVLAQDHVLEPTFSSIEEWLGHNTDDYYRVLAATGLGHWNPENGTRLWVRFNLRAHHMQAETLQRRFHQAEAMWNVIDRLVVTHQLPDRSADVLFDALLGLRVTRPTYVRRAELEVRTASRDLARLVEVDLLEPHGQTRGRYYTAGPSLLAERAELRTDRSSLRDPYPGLLAEIRSAATG